MSESHRSESHHASYQSTSAYVDSQSISNLTNEEADLVYTSELLTLLRRCTVVTPAVLFATSFPDINQRNAAPSEDIKNAFGNALSSYGGKFSEKDPRIYTSLQSAFNKCCPSQIMRSGSFSYYPKMPIRCVDCHSKRPKTESLTGKVVRRAPDLCLTFEDPSTYRPDMFYSTPAINIEFKGDPSADCDFTAVTDPHTDPESERGLQTQRQLGSVARKLLSQAFGYFVSQWFERPYRFMWSITIAGERLRIWRWSATDVLVTEVIDYIQDATPVYRFLSAIGNGPYSHLGVDIGPDMTFGMAGRIEMRKLSHILKCYELAIPPSETNKEWIKKALRSSVWTFKHSSTVITAQPKNDPPPQLLSNNAAVTTTKATSTETHLFVISHPIWRGKGVYSRNTRCYLAVKQSTFEKNMRFTIADLHMLKISWQFPSRTSECTFFGHIQAQDVEKSKYLATMLAGSTIQTTRQDEASLLPPASDLPHNINRDCRQLHWILFEQVGGRISGFRGVKELLQVVRDAIEAHGNLYAAGILHGDISENNVLTNLNSDNTGRRGLLIDLDMAQFVSYNDPKPDPEVEGHSLKRLPDITGTLLFMSVALNSRPNHQSWHDVESFYWLLIFVIIRHGRGIQLELLGHKKVLNLDDEHDRKFALSHIFADPQTGKDALVTVSERKKQFLVNWSCFSSTINAPLADLLNVLTEKIGLQYIIFDELRVLNSTMGGLAQRFQLIAPKMPFEDIWTAKCIEDVKLQFQALENAASSAKDSLDMMKSHQKNLIGSDGKSDLSSLNRGVREKMEDVNRKIKELHEFIDHETFIVELDAAIDSQTDVPAEPAVSYHPAAPKYAEDALKKGLEEFSRAQSGSGVSAGLASSASVVKSNSSGAHGNSKRKYSSIDIQDLPSAQNPVAIKSGKRQRKAAQEAFP